MEELLSFGISSVFFFPCVTSAGKHDAGSQDVGSDEGLGILDASVYMRLCCEVNYTVDVIFIKDLLDGILIGDISSDKSVITLTLKVLEILKVSCISKNVYVDDTNVINWKQGAGIKKGDTVFMYVAAPVSAVLYKCKVMETDIPYEHENKYITIRVLMKIKLQKRYAPDRFTFGVLKEEYGIFAVRGPRGIPNSLSTALKK